MSRDMTPREIHDSTIAFNLPKYIYMNLTMTINGETTDVFTKEEKDLFSQFPNLSWFGFDFLLRCKENHLLNVGGNAYEIVKIIDDYFNDVVDPAYYDLYDAVDKWYNGELCFGYYMEDNNDALVEQVLHYMSKKKGS